MRYICEDIKKNHEQLLAALKAAKTPKELNAVDYRIGQSRRSMLEGLEDLEKLGFMIDDRHAEIVETLEAGA